MWQWAYSAFGDEEPATAAKRFTGPNTTPTTGTTTATPVTFHPRYENMYADAESGLFFNWNRSYDPKTGRYTQDDPIGLGGGWNTRAFGFNNPLRYSDPNGLQVRRALLNPGGVVPGLAPRPVDPYEPHGPTYTPGISLPSFTLPGMIYDACKAIGSWMFSDGRPAGVPENWVEAPSRDGKGTKWIDPSNPKGGDYVRVRGDGTVTQVKDGRALDANGNPAPGLSSPEAHFPLDRWQFRP